MRDQDDLAFLQMLWERPVRVTYFLFAFNILIFVLMMFAGSVGNVMMLVMGALPHETLMNFGMKDNALIDQGELWRFVTPIFIHINLVHLLVNSYSLWIIGPHVEKLYGGARLFILYLLAGIGGVAASYWYHPFTPSAGASGAIFGLFGVLLAFVIKYRTSIPPQFRKALGRGIVMTVAINLFIGYQLEVVDNSAHLGGLFAGAAVAALIPYARPRTETSGFYKFLQGALVALVALSFVEVAVHYAGPPFSVPRLSGVSSGESGSSDVDLLGAIRAADDALSNSFLQLPFARKADFEDMKSSLAAAANGLRRAGASATAAKAIRREWMSLVDEQNKLVADIEISGGLVAFEHKIRLENNQRQYSAARARLQQR